MSTKKKSVDDRPQEDLGPRPSRSEELLYGSYAVIVRRLGDAAVASDKAMKAVAEALRLSREADEISRGQVLPPEMDAQGRTEHTRWMEEVVYRQAWDNYAEAAQTYASIAQQALARWTGLRNGLEAEGAGESTAVR